jgi:hypothetical protein
MKPPQTTIALLEQAPAGPNSLYKRINALLKTSGLERFRVAVAYARWEASA